MKLKEIKQLYSEINKKFFSDELPPNCLILLTKNKRIFGQTWSIRDQWKININRELILRTNYSIIEILAHEMIHIYQWFTDYSTYGNHDKKMLDILYLICNHYNIESDHFIDTYENL